MTTPQTQSPENTSPSQSRLARVLESGHFALTLEISPPVGPNRTAVERQIELLRDYGDAFNVTDNQSARIHTSSLAVSIMLKEAGLDPILQVTCRDRNRLGIQSDLLGASMYGITNVLALSGDAPIWGDHPQTKGVFEIDSINLVRVLRMMRDDQVFENGAEIPKIAPEYFIGAAANPFAPPHDFRPVRLAKKVAAGADFIQTQLVYNVPRFREYMKRVVDMGLHERTAILAGVGPIRSARGAEFMKNEVAGMDVPDEIIARMKGLDKDKAAEEGVNICIEIAEEVRQIEGVRGLHVMAVSWASILPELVTRLGLYPRPDVELQTVP
ncbi:MAG: methylenetetrahydrofolate reductase [Acidimicrobiia bacterium]|nr:methylenetetrahydrofolate reductase [Acidimicrobiia bacterium]